MKTNRAKLNAAITSKEYKVYNNFDDPWLECSCTVKRRYKGRIYKKPKFRPYHNRAGKCRYGNGHKSWKNYRKTQYREK